MAVDTKQILQRNVPLVGLYVVAIVPIVLWVLFVVSGVQGGAKDSYRFWALQLKQKKTALENISKDIQKDPSSVYTPDHKKKFTNRNEELDKQYGDMIKLVGDRDNALEKWMPALGDVGPGKLPPAPEFQSRLNTAIDGLKKDYADIVIDPTSKTLLLVLDPVAEGTQKKIQKQYWILERVLTALKKGGTVTSSDTVPVRLLSQVEFGQIPQSQGQPGPGQTAKKDPVIPIPVKLILQMSFRDISKVVRELLAQDVVFRLKSLHTELLPFSITKPDLGVTVNADPKPLYEQTIYNATLGQGGVRPADEELVFPEPKLKVTIELEAMDFDMDVINPQPAK